MENNMRKYITEKERNLFRSIIVKSEKQHIEKFEIEDYCRDHDIDYSIIAAEVDSIRYAVKIEELDKQAKEFYDEKQKRTYRKKPPRRFHIQDDTTWA